MVVSFKDIPSLRQRWSPYERRPYITVPISWAKRLLLMSLFLKGPSGARANELSWRSTVFSPAEEMKACWLHMASGADLRTQRESGTAGMHQIFPVCLPRVYCSGSFGELWCTVVSCWYKMIWELTSQLPAEQSTEKPCSVGRRVKATACRRKMNKTKKGTC